LVGQPALGELVPQLADRVIALRVGGAEVFGRCGRVRRRPSHEWSIGVICLSWQENRTGGVATGGQQEEGHAPTFRPGELSLTGRGRRGRSGRGGRLRGGPARARSARALPPRRSLVNFGLGEHVGLPGTKPYRRCVLSPQDLRTKLPVSP